MTTPLSQISPLPSTPVSRREAMQWVMSAAAASALSSVALADPVKSKTSPPTIAGAKGYGTDPNLMTPYKPGDYWPLTFSAAQHKIARRLADIIIPADELGPAASEAGVVERLDEWVSAPYPDQQADHPLILDGLAWLEAESRKRFAADFTELKPERSHAICDDICSVARAVEPFKKPSIFFNRFRTLCSAAYYSTPVGWKAIGYVGNVPLASFDGPPAEVLAKLGVVQTIP